MITRGIFGGLVFRDGTKYCLLCGAAGIPAPHTMAVPVMGVHCEPGARSGDGGHEGPFQTHSLS